MRITGQSHPQRPGRLARFAARFRRDNRGNSLILTGIALPAIVGTMGLGVDFAQWVLWKRALQSAADSAALAGAQSRFSGHSDALVTTEATKVVNGNADIPRSLTQVEFVASPGQGAGATPTSVRVTLEARGRLYFAGLFMSASPTIRVSATAGPRGYARHCILALHPTAQDALRIFGNAEVNTSCGIMSNSTHSRSVYVEGNAEVVSSEVSAAGGITTEGNATITGTQSPGSTPQIDPFGPQGRNLQPPSCASYTPMSWTKDATSTVNPGCYSIPNGGEFKLDGNGTVNLNPGVYVFHGDGKLNIDGNVRINCNGCSIVLTGGAWLEVNGNPPIDMRAMTTSEAAGQPDAARQALAGVLFWQVGTSRQQNFITGNTTMTVNGAFYMPSMPLSIHGNFSAQSTCVQLVARTIVMEGNAGIPNTCPANDDNFRAFDTSSIVLTA